MEEGKAKGAKNLPSRPVSWVSTSLVAMLTYTAAFQNFFLAAFPNQSKSCANVTSYSEAEQWLKMIVRLLRLEIYVLPLGILLWHQMWIPHRTSPDPVREWTSSAKPDVRREYRTSPHIVAAPSCPHPSLSAFPCNMPVVKVNNDIFVLLFKRSPWKPFWDWGPEI